MNTLRAREIASSPEMVHVTYDDEPIYIQHVDEQNEMVRIYPLNQPENERTVPVRNLVEH